MDIREVDLGKRRFIGTKAFYMLLLSVAVPMMIQNGITNVVGMLDNLMIGRIGTEQMSGVAIVNQLLFVYYLCIFGGISGAGIFTAQFYGQRNDEGIRQTFRYKLWLSAVVTVAAIIVMAVFDDELIGIYLQGEGTKEQIRNTLLYGKQYLAVMLWGLPFVMLTNVYVGTLRECGETVLPMKAGIAAVVVNLIFNYLLIFGKAGFPVLGVRGAAIATVISRIVEMAIVIVWTHRHTEKNPFAKRLYSTMRVPFALVRKILIKGTPLLLNEALWSLGVSALVQCYSVRGYNVVAALNIANTINNVFNIVFIALGDSVAILIGQLLGAGLMEKAKDADRKIIAFSVFSCLGVAALMIAAAPFFPKLFRTEEEVMSLATAFIIINAAFMPMNAYLHAGYFTLRSGGNTLITFVFDSLFMWVVSVPLAYYLSRFTGLAIIGIYIGVNSAELLKCLLGYILLKKGVWLNNIVSE